MSVFRKRESSAVARRLRRVQAEIELIDRCFDAGSASAGGRLGQTPVAAANERDAGVVALPADRSGSARPERREAGRPGFEWSLSRDVELGGHLSRRIGAGQPLRYEAQLQRNRAIMMALFAGLLLFWLFYHFMR